MYNFNLEIYARITSWISQQIRQESWESDWENVKHFFVGNEDDERAVFNQLCIDNIMPRDINYEDWPLFVEEYKATFGNYSPVCGFSNGKVNNCTIPSGPTSSWVAYKNYLLREGGWSQTNVDAMERNCHWILQHLKKDTTDGEYVKGLVMGSVQSGKTANMVGLITMAADSCRDSWNVFIVLSGTIENLRQQTRNRFVNDLRKAGRKNWHVIDYVDDDKNEMYDIMNNECISLDRLNLNGAFGNRFANYADRYVFICLKNSRRLERLITGLHYSDECAANMRILMIDDEADQASINTRTNNNAIDEHSENWERTTVNRYIINLVNGLNYDNSIPRNRFQAMNYISYTATPYANVLNEAYSDSLYPRSFICALPEPNEYFGAKVIFGSNDDPDKYPGLNIVRDISGDEVEFLTGKNPDKAKHKKTDNMERSVSVKNKYEISDLVGLKKALAWFLCASAVLRNRRERKARPISMLIHTSSTQNDHKFLYKKLKNYLEKDALKNNILKECEQVYSKEQCLFQYKDLEEGFPNYSNIEDVKSFSFPKFDDIEQDISNMIQSVQSIDLNQAGDIVWSDGGVYLCEDNCGANFDADYGTQLRVAYPDGDSLAKMTKSPVFIVIGGNTLSRGLTLEGLVCTYFVRNSNQADTLMQMARWFGFRRGYELLQRIWMPKNIVEKFKTMEKIDEKLKDEFRLFMDRGLCPAQAGPKIMSSYEIAMFLLTARNRQQNAVPVDLDFTGDSYEVLMFEDDVDILQNNVNVTNSFLKGIGDENTEEKERDIPEKSQDNSHAYVWRGVSSEYIMNNFLKLYTIFDCSSLSTCIPIFMDWMKKMNNDNQFLYWNVVASGSSRAKSYWNPIEGVNVGKVKRSRKNNPRVLDIGSLFSGSDVLSDIRLDRLTLEQRAKYDEAKKTGKDFKNLRSELGLADYPLLLLYMIDKNSSVDDDDRKNLRNRIPLNSQCDIVGFSIVMPGDPSNSHVSKVAVRMPEED